MKEKLRNVTLIILFVGIILCLIAVSYSYFEPLINNIESKSTIKLDGVEIYANYTSTSTLYIEDVEPSDNIIGYKDFSLEVKNTSSKDVSAYIYLDILYSDYTDIANDGVLYYELVSDNTTIVDKTMIKAIKSGKALLYELVIPKGTKSTTINYRLNIYFPTSNKIQNLNKGEDGTMKFNGKIEILNESKTLSDYILSLYNTESGKTYLRDDETVDHNIRYYGSERYSIDVPIPNYVSFNNELWRIIGVFDTYNADTEETEKAVKLIRNESLGNYSWDTSESTINGGNGVNAWNDADLMYELNGDYLNPNLNENTYWYNGENNQKTGEYDRTKSISYEYQQYIINARWYLGGYDQYKYVSAADMYRYERNGEGSMKTIPGETCSGDYCNDTVVRDDYWDGKIGLIYPSDFGLATNSPHCLDNIGGTDEGYVYCSTVLSSYTCAYTITHNAKYAAKVFSLSYSGYYIRDTGFNASFSDSKVYPALYLKSSTLITGGSGLSSDPYIIQ